jgi:hypothetical protein
METNSRGDFGLFTIHNIQCRYVSKVDYDPVFMRIAAHYG